MNSHHDKREIGRLLLNCHQFVAIPALVVGNDSKDTEIREPSCTPQMETNVDIESDYNDLQSSYSDFQTMIWV